MEALTFNLKQHKGKLRYNAAFPKAQIQNPDDVLIQVAYAGVCGTDLHIMEVIIQKFNFFLTQNMVIIT